MATWRDFGRFVRRPQLPDFAAGPGGASLRRLLAILALDMAIMIPLILLALGAEALGVEFPDNALDDLAFNTQEILLIVFAIPLFEELLFRGWLSGRPGHLLAYAVCIAAAIVLAVGASAGAAIKGLVIGVAIALAGYWIWKLRHKPALAWFQRHFLWFFAASTLIFAFIHVFNYEDTSNLVFLLPLVIPQFIVGLLLGYARVTLGLWACCLLHFLHNGLLVAGVLTFGM